MTNIYSVISEAIKNGESVVLETRFSSENGKIADSMAKTVSALVLPEDSSEPETLDAGSEKTGDGYIVREPILPRERLIILGGGHVGLCVGEFAAKCGFSVYIADDRPDFANSGRFPWAAGVVCDSFENAIRGFNITPYDYVVIVTRGHSHDADSLRAVLSGTEPAYLGMIGSRKRVAAQLQMLAGEGYSRDRISRVCTPIGLKIGSVTPEEIAVSILAEVIAYKRLPENNHNGRYLNASDLDYEMIEYLAENKEPKAVVTVIETKGSTPRGAGAKMAVSPLGKVTGSIGGGCSEAAVIQDAVRIIGTGRYKLVDIDLTGEVAESDGMVCGGTMLVLVEDGSEKA